MKKSIAWVVLGWVVSCAGTSTGGTETSNPATLEHFGASECKTRAPEAGRGALSLSSETDGLQCVEWSRDADGTLSLKLLNFVEPCGEAYLGAAELAADGALELSVYKDSCEVFRCGSCLFDFEFRVTGVTGDVPLTLRTGTATCKTQPVSWEESLRLPLDERASGTICRYVRQNALEQYATTRGTCGQRNMPCGDCSNTAASDCAEGLTCSLIAERDSRCLAGCSSDQDCGSATACVDGVCRSELTF